MVQTLSQTKCATSVPTGAMETAGAAGNFDPCVKLVAGVWFLVLEHLCSSSHSDRSVRSAAVFHENDM